MSGELDEVVEEFLVESYENLDQVERDLVTLEELPDDPEILARIFRTVHTIKGTCGFLGYGKLERVAHVGENLLSKLRDGTLSLDEARTSALLGMSDAIRQILEAIEATAEEGDGDYTELVARLERLVEDDPPASAEAAPQAAPVEAAPVEAAPVEAAPVEAAPVEAAPVEAAPVEAAPVEAAPVEAAPVEAALVEAAPVEAAPVEAAPVDSPDGKVEVPPLGQMLVEQNVTTTEVVDSALEAQKRGDSRRIGEILVGRGVSPGEVDEAVQEQRQARGSIADSSVRVSVDVLDSLMNLVGELVLARNQVLQYTLKIDDAGFLATSQRLNLVTTELQEGVMKTRMQPIGNVWSKFPRVVRDLAHACGKQIKLIQEGREVELDKTLVEAIKDPLTHLVRNSVDHGIETPAVREAAGKSGEGHLVLRAFHEGGQVIIEITDDGGGIDPRKIKAKALEKGLISAERASRMGEREALHLIFKPGFSTAAKVTNVSGRGVGMDVVKTNIERIGGTVDVTTELGVSTTFKIKIPLTLAIIPALLVKSGGDRFAIPQVSLLELVRLEGDIAREAIETIQGTPVYRLRGNLLPLVDLRTALEQPVLTDTDDVINIVVLQADDQNFGLIVEAVQDTEEIVVKPLGSQLKGIGTYAGATILGDGRIALILDVMGIAQRSNVVTRGREARSKIGDDDQSNLDATQRQTFLLFDVVNERSMAIPLSTITRLEEFPSKRVERAGTGFVVQYRNDIMPLVRLADAISGLGHAPPADDDAMLQVIVYTKNGRNVGLVVDRILDVVEDRVDLQVVGKRHGVLGSAIIDGRVIELVDVDGVVRAEVGDLLPAPSMATIGA